VAQAVPGAVVQLLVAQSLGRVAVALGVQVPLALGVQAVVVLAWLAVQ